MSAGKASADFFVGNFTLLSLTAPRKCDIILIINKTIGKKSLYNLYMQDYVRFFVQFLIDAEYNSLND